MGDPGQSQILVKTPSPQRQIAFLTNVQRLLSEGSFVATYKVALLMSPADICAEHGTDAESELSITALKIAEEFIQ